MPLNDDAMAYGFSMIVLYFIAGLAIWLCWSYVFNIILGTFVNPDIVAGTISMQTKNAVAWNVDVLRYAPPVILIAGFIYAVNRSVYKRQGST